MDLNIFSYSYTLSSLEGDCIDNIAGSIYSLNTDDLSTSSIFAGTHFGRQPCLIAYIGGGSLCLFN
jgi:hypothetical protein